MIPDEADFVSKYDVWEDRTREPFKLYRVDPGIHFENPAWVRLEEAPCSAKHWALGRIVR